MIPTSAPADHRGWYRRNHLFSIVLSLLDDAYMNGWIPLVLSANYINVDWAELQSALQDRAYRL